MSKSRKTIFKEIWKWKVTRAEDDPDPRIKGDNWSLIDDLGYPFTWEIWSDPIGGGYYLSGSPNGLEIYKHFSTLSKAKQFVKENILHRLYDNDTTGVEIVFKGEDCTGLTT